MDVYRDIYYTEDDKWTRLPDWCHSYLHLGGVIACASLAERRMVFALAVPTRAYASALISAGLVISRLSDERPAESEEDHMRVLRGLERGTPVIIYEGATKTKGAFIAVEDNYYDGKTYVGVQIQEPSDKAGALTRWLPARSAKRVAVLEGAVAQALRLPRECRSEALVKNQAFVSHFLSPDAQRTIATKSQSECMIVGQVNLLKRELVETVFGVLRDGYRAGKDSSGQTHSLAKVLTRFAKGRLQDIVRAHRFCRDGEPFRSRIIPGTKTDPSGVEDSEASVIVFDGAAGFLRLRHCWPKAHLVVLLDRTDPHFVDAVNHINQGFVNRIEEAELQYAVTLPAGAHATSYWELR